MTQQTLYTVTVYCDQLLDVYRIPHIVKASEGVEIDPKYYERQYTMVDTTNFKKVTQGMWRAVNSGFEMPSEVQRKDACQAILW